MLLLLLLLLLLFSLMLLLPSSLVSSLLVASRCPEVSKVPQLRPRSSSLSESPELDVSAIEKSCIESREGGQDCVVCSDSQVNWLLFCQEPGGFF